jgi:hypothetical protein
MFGIKFPILVLKSPHIMVYNYGWMLSIIYSNYVVACNYDILRFSRDVVGGMYTFIILIR